MFYRNYGNSKNFIKNESPWHNTTNLSDLIHKTMKVTAV